MEPVCTMQTLKPLCAAHIQCTSMVQPRPTTAGSTAVHVWEVGCVRTAAKSPLLVRQVCDVCLRRMPTYGLTIS